jgi:hypothetical protein
MRVDLLSVRSLPFMTRRNYTQEFWQMAMWSGLAGVVEHQFAGVIVALSFAGSERLVAIASSTHVASMMTSLWWGMFCMGRPKIRLLTLCSAGAALLAVGIGVIPHAPQYAVWFVVQMALAQVLLAGVVTVRSAVWKANYPRSDRGRITSRLQAIRVVVSVVTVLAAGALCEHDPAMYRVIFPVVGVLGALSIISLLRIHVRGERQELRGGPREGDDPDDLRPGMAEPHSLAAVLHPGNVLGQMVRVLRDDDRFRSYCIAQLMIGMSNLMTVPIVIVMIAQRLPIGDEWAFWVSTVVVVAMRRLVALGTLPRWGRLFDRLGVVRFRVINGSCWAATLLFGFTADALLRGGDLLSGVGFLLALLALVGWAMMQGVGMGGGALAWNLGHLHFAHPRDAEIYMGIHVSLTGMRGLIAPLLGVWLWGNIGLGMWAVAVGFASVSLTLFSAMARHERDHGMPTRPGDVPKG